MRRPRGRQKEKKNEKGYDLLEINQRPPKTMSGEHNEETGLTQLRRGWEPEKALREITVQAQRGCGGAQMDR